jgi:hypothetical protein
MPFFATIPTTIINPMKDATLKVVRVTSKAKKTPQVESRADERTATGAEKLRNSKSKTVKTRSNANIRTMIRS